MRDRSRRELLGLGSVALAGLAGCSALRSESHPDVELLVDNVLNYHLEPHTVRVSVVDEDDEEVFRRSVVVDAGTAEEPSYANISESTIGPGHYRLHVWRDEGEREDGRTLHTRDHDATGCLDCFVMIGRNTDETVTALSIWYTTNCGELSHADGTPGTAG
ncbi:MAG: hypothetical protein ACI9YT_000813 [Halobacteriales archaeon]|jgi:hypothetical protein